MASTTSPRPSAPCAPAPRRAVVWSAVWATDPMCVADASRRRVPSTRARRCRWSSPGR